MWVDVMFLLDHLVMSFLMKLDIKKHFHISSLLELLPCCETTFLLSRS